MPIDFFIPKCSNTLNNKKFGLCDDPPPSKAPTYTSTSTSDNWIEIVKNSNRYDATFIAVDECIELKKANGHQDKRCDCMLAYTNKLVFIELKNRNSNGWMDDAEEQLRVTIGHFISNHSISSYTSKVAYIANKRHPKFRSGQQTRMDRFKDDTGVRLRIENDIVLT